MKNKIRATAVCDERGGNQKNHYFGIKPKQEIKNEKKYEKFDDSFVCFRTVLRVYNVGSFGAGGAGFYDN
jgi:hypothetical protein